jgi:hypothetical protein
VRFRYQPRIVSNWAAPATSSNAFRPSRRAISANVAFSSYESNSRPLIWAFRMRFSAARYSFRNRSSWSTVPNVGQQLRPNHFGPFLIALTESWKEDCKCCGSFSESNLKRIVKDPATYPELSCEPNDVAARIHRFNGLPPKFLAKTLSFLWFHFAGHSRKVCTIKLSHSGVHSTGPKLRDWGRDGSGKCFAIRKKVGGREGI